MQHYDIIIIGAGASGLCAAAEAQRTAEARGRHLQILMIEKEKSPGKKLLATGNGRCNLGNKHMGAEYYPLGDPSFIENIFAACPPQENLDFFREIGIPTFDDGSGRLYPLSRRAGAVVQALRTECERVGAQLLCETAVTSIKKTGRDYLVNGGYAANCLILAAGGSAGLRKTDAYNGYGLLQQNPGIRVTPTFPCLCGLKLAGGYPSGLKGVRNISRAAVYSGDSLLFAETGEVQFNADVISGIPVLQASVEAARALADGKPVTVALDLLPSLDADALRAFLTAVVRRYPATAAEQLFGGYLPKPLCVYLLKRAGVAPSAPFPPQKVPAFIQTVKRCDFPVAGTADLPDAQVTGGGADLACFHADTLEAKRLPGLFACGEILNVTGRCGGYNLMWAWSSGRLAGRSAAKKICNRQESSC